MNFRFKEIRENLELKQREVANKINISRGGYANIEAETANIKLKDFLTYCNTFNLTMDYVLKLTDINDISSINCKYKLNKSILSKRLSTLEKENKKEAKDIAKELGIGKSTYSNYKNIKIKNNIQTLMLKEIAKKYNYSIDWLIGRSDNKTIKKNPENIQK